MEAAIYTVFAVFAVYGIYTALREAVLLLRGRGRGSRNLCEGCGGCAPRCGTDDDKEVKEVKDKENPADGIAKGGGV